MERISGPGGTECFRFLHEKSGAEAIISRHGGHLLSWKTADGKERLYLSETADYQPGKAIRGGVPVIFPQFSDRGPFGRHGFARKMDWTPDSESGLMTLRSSEATLADWPYEFELSLGVDLLSATALEITMSVRNSGQEAFPFQAALHSYFQVDDLSETVVTGLEGKDFENEVTKQTEAADEREGIAFGEEVDRAYLGVGNRPVIVRAGSESLLIESGNFPDVVVWNPGPDHGIGDLPTEGWQHFVCVESARIGSERTLAPGDSWSGSQRIQVSIEAVKLA